MYTCISNTKMNRAHLLLLGEAQGGDFTFARKLQCTCTSNKKGPTGNEGRLHCFTCINNDLLIILVSSTPLQTSGGRKRRHPDYDTQSVDITLRVRKQYTYIHVHVTLH